MATKTITVTDDAYNALRALKDGNESFSETILRVAKRKPLSSFYGILSKKSADDLEKSIADFRKRKKNLHKKRIERITKEMSE